MNVEEKLAALEAEIKDLRAQVASKPKLRMRDHRGCQIVTVGNYAYSWPGPGELCVGDQVRLPLSWVDRARGNTIRSTSEVTGLGTTYDGPLVDIVGRVVDSKFELADFVSSLPADTRPRRKCCGMLEPSHRHLPGCPVLAEIDKKIDNWQVEFKAQNKKGPRCGVAKSDDRMHCISYEGHPEGKHWWTWGCLVADCPDHPPVEI